MGKIGAKLIDLFTFTHTKVKGGQSSILFTAFQSFHLQDPPIELSIRERPKMLQICVFILIRHASCYNSPIMYLQNFSWVVC